MQTVRQLGDGRETESDTASEVELALLGQRVERGRLHVAQQALAARPPEVAAAAGFWGRRWIRGKPSAEQLDPVLLMWTTLRTMVEVWRGERDHREALRAGAIELKGPSRLTRAFPGWLLLSMFADEAPAAS